MLASTRELDSTYCFICTYDICLALQNSIQKNVKCKLCRRGCCLVTHAKKNVRVSGNHPEVMGSSPETTSCRNAGKDCIHKTQSGWTLPRTRRKRELRAPCYPLSGNHFLFLVILLQYFVFNHWCGSLNDIDIA
jgi:hypothetical protein